MAEPKKGQIADAAVAYLKGVLTGAGYWSDLGKNVSRRRVVAQEIATLNLPLASVWTGDSEPAPAVCAGSYRDRVKLLVEVFYRSAERENVDRDGIRIEADVRKSLLTTSQLGLSGTVHSIRPAEVKTDMQEFADAKLGWKVVGFEVDYNWTADAP